MLGPILTFIFVCAIVAIFMAIAHSFLRASEEPEDVTRERQRREAAKPGAPQSQDSQNQKPQWAH